MRSPPSSRTAVAMPSVASMASTLAPVFSVTPLSRCWAAICPATFSPHFLAKGASSGVTTVTALSRWTRAAAASMPMKPEPTMTISRSSSLARRKASPSFSERRVMTFGMSVLSRGNIEEPLPGAAKQAS